MLLVIGFLWFWVCLIDFDSVVLICVDSLLLQWVDCLLFAPMGVCVVFVIWVFVCWLF